MVSQVATPELFDVRSQIAASVGAVDDLISSKLDVWLRARTPSTFRAMELNVAALCRELADELVEHILRAIVGDPEFFVPARKAARAGLGPLRNGGGRKVTVTLLGGRRVQVLADYLRPNLSGRPGPRRGHGRRGKSGAGVYPALAALGIDFGVTPALAGEVARQVTDSDSIRAGLTSLARRGIELEYKQTLRIVNSFGQRAVRQRDEWLADALEAESTTSGPLARRRIVVATDGGRVRERVARPGRPRAETGHHRFEAPWREPKLFTIYVIDPAGKVDRRFRPIYDGTMGDADEAFAMLVGYLKALGASSAKTLTIIGDGAKWIWGRARDLVEMVGVPEERVAEIIDWYHAVETLDEVSKLPASRSEAERKAWLKRAKSRLYAGEVDEVMSLFDEIAVGRRAKAVNRHRGYFTTNAARMQYAAFKERRLPLGSGAVESAIRMIVNMRLKGTGRFWKLENVHAMLLLRSYLKAGRFDDLVDWSNAKATGWWSAGGAVPSAPIEGA